MIDLQIQHHFTPDLYAKEMHLPMGFKATSHRHEYDHISMLYSGLATVDVAGQSTTYCAPAFILIRAGLEHEITAIEDVVWYCVHETDITDIAMLDKVLIKEN